MQHAANLEWPRNSAMGAFCSVSRLNLQLHTSCTTWCNTQKLTFSPLFPIPVTKHSYRFNEYRLLYNSAVSCPSPDRPLTPLRQCKYYYRFLSIKTVSGVWLNHAQSFQAHCIRQTAMYLTYDTPLRYSSATPLPFSSIVCLLIERTWGHSMKWCMLHHMPVLCSDMTPQRTRRPHYKICLLGLTQNCLNVSHTHDDHQDGVEPGAMKNLNSLVCNVVTPTGHSVTGCTKQFAALFHCPAVLVTRPAIDRHRTAFCHATEPGSWWRLSEQNTDIANCQ